jgi:hypothetical protein
MTITVKSLIDKLQKLNPNRCVYIEGVDGNYLELEDGSEVVDDDGICILVPKFYYTNEQGIEL